MEVMRKNPRNPAFLSNYEVYKLLNELKGQTTQNQASSHLATILYEVSHYLQDSPCSKQTDTDVEELLKALKKFPVQLSKKEKLMIVNNPPKSQLQLSLIVKDVEDRLNEEQSEELLQIISKHLGLSIV